MLQPGQAEALGLLALMPYCEARRLAQFVPRTAQNTYLWGQAQIDEAGRRLRLAAQQCQPDSVQLEAAIHSAHCQRAFSGQTPWSAIAHLSGLLVANFRSTGASVGHAGARAEAGDVPQRADAPACHARRRDRSQTALLSGLGLERRAGHTQDAEAALQRALDLITDPRVRAHLRAKAPTDLAK